MMRNAVCLLALVGATLGAPARDSTWMRTITPAARVDALRKTLVAHDMKRPGAPVKRLATATLPESYDLTVEYPGCKDTILYIRNQGQCGDCWAVSSAGAFSDRYCIANNMTVGSGISTWSAEDTMQCVPYTSGHGCGGGFPLDAWQWFVRYGVVTGSDSSSTWGCKPYPTDPAYYQSCVQQCQPGWKDSYEADKRHASAAYNIDSAEQMQLHLMNGGSIVATFQVFSDFMHYQSGVYQRTEGATSEGWHAVRVIGWGVENGVDYWLVANSWGTDWGLNGLFKIRRGVNECSFEEYTAGGDVAADRVKLMSA